MDRSKVIPFGTILKRKNKSGYGNYNSVEILGYQPGLYLVKPLDVRVNTNHEVKLSDTVYLLANEVYRHYTVSLKSFKNL